MNTFCNAFLLCFIAFGASVNGQLFAALNGACLSSAHCLGVAVCESHVCQCPGGYNAVGEQCMATGDWPPPGSQYPYPEEDPAPFFSLLAPSPLQHVPPPPALPRSAPPPPSLPQAPLPPPPQPYLPPPPVPQPLPAAAPPPPPPPVQTLTIGQLLPFGSLQLGGPPPNPPPIVRTSAVQYQAPAPPPPPPPPPPAPAPPAASYAGPVPPPAPVVHFAYPGENCIGDKTCLGYSFCWQGRCGCPRNFMQYGSACVSSVPVSFPSPQSPHSAQPAPTVLAHGIPPAAPGPAPIPALPPAALFMQNPAAPLPWHIAALLPPFALNGCPSGEIMLDSACKSTATIADYPTGIPCHQQGNCYGGSTCMHSLCMCPVGYAWKPDSGSCTLDAAASMQTQPQMQMPVGFSHPNPQGPIAAPPPQHGSQQSQSIGVPYNGPTPNLSGLPLRGWLPIIHSTQTHQTTTVVLGSPCLASTECQVGIGYGSYCQVGVCNCRPSYEKSGRYSCVLKKKAKLSNVAKTSSGPLGRASNVKSNKRSTSN